MCFSFPEARDARVEEDDFVTIVHCRSQGHTASQSTLGAKWKCLRVVRDQDILILPYDSGELDSV